MTREDINIAIKWAADEGWNPGLYDAESFYITDPNGFLIAELNEQPIGCISVVAYDNNFGFLGFYIVKPEFRGQGYGLQIWQKGMEYLGNRNIGLDGVIAQQQNYKKSGFKLAYKNIRYEGIAEKYESNDLIDIKTVPFKEIIDYDRQMFPSERTQFLKSWINQPKSLALCELNNDKLVGYAVLRPCQQGYKIGPLFADNESIALKLFHGLTSNITGEKFYIDVPELNKPAIAIAEKHAMHMVFETARMYTKNSPSLLIEKIFGVTTFELG